MSSVDSKFSGEIFRKDHPIILAGRRDLASIKPIRVKFNAGGWPAGQVMGRVTADGEFKDYDDGAVDGSEVAVGVLFEGIAEEDFDPTGTGTVTARLIVGGEVFKTKLTGLDANGEADLNARTIIDGTGVEILKF